MPSIRAVKEVFKALPDCVTIKYPYGPPAHVPEGLRGKPLIDHEKCIGCGACTLVCSSGAASMTENSEGRTININLGKCIFCALCADSCPTGAITLTKEFELTTNNLENCHVSNNVEMTKCEKCGSLIAPKSQLNWGLKTVLEKIDKETKAIVEEDAKKYLTLCLSCRRITSIKMNTHTKKYV